MTIAVSPTDVLETIDSALYLGRKASEALDPADTGTDSLWGAVSNQFLVLRSQAYALAMQVEQPWRRSFEMRAEECDQEFAALLQRVRKAQGVAS